MRIMYLNNHGAGFAAYVDIAHGTTVEQLFSQKMPHGRPGDYLIRVNRQPTTADYVLQDNDRVSITPTKIEGATCCTHFSPTKGARWERGNSSTLST